MARPAVRNSTSSPNRTPRYVSSCALASCAVLALLHAGTLAAQDQPTLEDLIPDSAVEDPESWAEQSASGEPETTSPEQTDESELFETLENSPDMVAWPDAETVERPEPLQEDGDLEFADLSRGGQGDSFAVPEQQQEKVFGNVTLSFPAEDDAFPEREAFLDRFESLSSIGQNGKGADLARIAAQAREDERLLDRLLRNYGYYDGRVIRTIVGADGDSDDDSKPQVQFDIIPGAQYAFGALDLGELEEAGADLDKADWQPVIETGGPLIADHIVEERDGLNNVLSENGYPFVMIQPPQLLVDHARQEGDLSMEVSPGGKYAFGDLTSSMPGFLSDAHLARIARFKPGETYQASMQEDLRQAILNTGLVSSVEVNPVEMQAPSSEEAGVVDMHVELEKARLRTIAGALGYGTGEGFKAEARWEHRNMFPSEGMLRVRGIAGTREQLLGATFRKNNFKGRDRILTIDTFASTIDNDAYDAKTISLLSTYEKVSTQLFQKPLSWGGGLELVATEQAERKVKGAKSPDQKFLIAALPTHAQIDTSDDLLDPTRGFRLRGALSPELSRTSSKNSTYLKVQFDLSKYQSVSDNVVLAARARMGSILGTQIFNIAPSRRFYAGGGGSVRGYGYHAIGPRNGVGDPNGGRSLFEVSAEARIRTGLMDGAIGIVPFVDAGTVDRGIVPDFNEIRVGAGVGLRYLTDFGPIRIDVGVPLNPKPGDGPVGVYVALGQAF